ncbi:PKD domain-containing protein [Bacteroidota bacterium]
MRTTFFTLIIVLSLPCTDLLYAQVGLLNADFSANQTNISLGDSVIYIDLSTGSPTSWQWIFQGGTPSTYNGQNPPPITYNTAGTYNTTLIISDSATSDTLKKQAYITVTTGGPANCDTLSNMLPSDVILYYYVHAPGWGWVPGHNSDTIKEYADLFTNNQIGTISEVRVDVSRSYAGSTQSYVTFKIYSGGAYPGTVLGSQQVPISNFTIGQIDTVNFTTPVYVNGDFYVGFELNYTTPLDTFCTYCALDRGPSGSNTAFLKYNNSWTDFATLWGIYTSIYIEPILCTGSSPTADFTANLTNIIEGQNVTFSDSSSGSPTSWNWIFNGGTPAMYSGQAPPNITFNTAGSYDVTLVVSNASGSDTIVKTNYISVAPASSSACDTLHFPLSGTKNLYTASNWGWVSGNNNNGHMAKAEYFTNFTPYSLLYGILFDFAVASTPASSTLMITVVVWNNNGSGGKPGSIAASTTISLSSIVTDVGLGNMTYVPFSNPVAISGAFYAGFFLPAGTGDTLAIYTNTDNDVVPGTAWEMWSDSSWHEYNDSSSWGLDLVNAIYPYVCQTTVGMEMENYNNYVILYPNPTNARVNLIIKEEPVDINIQIYNSLGQMIDQVEILKNSDNIYTMDLSECDEGLYYVSIYLNSKKIVKKVSLIK